MPSEKVLEQKKQVVAELSEMLKGSVAGVVVDYKGINVADDTALRKELREAGVKYSVVKNTLLGFAAKEAGARRHHRYRNKPRGSHRGSKNPFKVCRHSQEFFYQERLS